MTTPFHLKPFLESFNKIFGTRHGALFAFIWSFIVGILVASCVHVSFVIVLLIPCLGVAVFLFDKKFLLVFLALLGLGLGGIRFDIKDAHQPSALESKVGENVSIEGIVESEPELRDKDMRFVFQTDTDKILVSTNLYSDIHYGDRLKIEGKIKKPGVIEGDVSDSGGSGKSFDYGAYLSKDDIYYTMSFAHAEVIGHGEGNSVITFLLKVKESFVQKMKVILPEPEASLLAGLLVSGKQALPSSIVDEFQRAGVIHIVVLSGYNVTVVANFFLRIFAGLGLRLAGGLSIFGIFLFTLMTGATATVVRASIMAIVSVSGKLFGRTYSVTRALLVAAFFMLLQNPKILVFDPSFQLSFLATIAMIYVSPLTDEYLKNVPEKLGLRSILSATLSTQLFVLPYLLYQIGNVSVVALFSNILILGVVPFTMLIGFIATLIAYASPLVALPITYVTHLLLAWILGVARDLGGLSWASVQISIPLWAMIVCYGAIGVILWWLRRTENSVRSRSS